MFIVYKALNGIKERHSLDEQQRSDLLGWINDESGRRMFLLHKYIFYSIMYFLTHNNNSCQCISKRYALYPFMLADK